eukprot:1337892-Amphidinium_carterae.2
MEALKDVDGTLGFPWEEYPERQQVMTGLEVLKTFGKLGAEAAGSDPIKLLDLKLTVLCNFSLETKQRVVRVTLACSSVAGHMKLLVWRVCPNSGPDDAACCGLSQGKPCSRHMPPSSSSVVKEANDCKVLFYEKVSSEVHETWADGLCGVPKRAGIAVIIWSCCTQQSGGFLCEIDLSSCAARISTDPIFALLDVVTCRDKGRLAWFGLHANYETCLLEVICRSGRLVQWLRYESISCPKLCFRLLHVPLLVLHELCRERRQLNRPLLRVAQLTRQGFNCQGLAVATWQSK